METQNDKTNGIDSGEKDILQKNKPKYAPMPEIVELLNIMRYDELAIELRVSISAVYSWKRGVSKPHRVYFDAIRALHKKRCKISE